MASGPFWIIGLCTPVLVILINVCLNVDPYLRLNHLFHVPRVYIILLECLLLMHIEFIPCICLNHYLRYLIFRILR